MLYLLEQYNTKLEGNRSQLNFKQDLFLRGSSRKLWLPLSALGLLAAIVNWQPANALTFNDTSNVELQRVCGTDGTTPKFANGNLSGICTQLGFGQGGQNNSASVGVGTHSQPNSILISQQQLKDQQTEKERKEIHDSSGDAVAANWGNFSTFLTAGATTLRHRNNEFEQGYEATIPSVTLGGGYLISNSLEAGLAFNYSNSNGDIHNYGGFNVDSYTPLLYINYLPFDHAFANLALGYTRQNQTNDRLAIATNANNNNINNNTPVIIPGLTKGNLNANQYALNFLSGYDHPIKNLTIENITIGPRVGVDVRQWEMNGYNESSNTGLELSYNSQHQTSIQSTLGLAASYAHRTPYGDFVPQLTAFWVHEYANNSRTINAHFVQTNDFATSSGFFFQTENPARNWAVINLGASLMRQKGVEVFANFSTVQGNSNFESYGGNLGIRAGW